MLKKDSCSFDDSIFLAFCHKSDNRQIAIDCRSRVGVDIGVLFGNEEEASRTYLGLTEGRSDASERRGHWDTVAKDEKQV